VAGLRVLAKCLEGVPGLEVMTVRADGKWKEGPELLDRADGVVLFLSEGAKWLDSDAKRLAALQRLADRKGALVVLHWAMGTRDAKHIAACLKLLGGCHGGPDRKYKVLATEARPTDHPVAKGLRPFRVKDEFYYQLKFVRPAGTVRPVLRVEIDGKDETVAWAWQRPDGGRSFGFSGLHFHDNWKLAEYRRLVAQGVLWALRLPMPKEGLRTEVDAATAPAPGFRRLHPGL
jgi:type 1 glutamine amidotransferase